MKKVICFGEVLWDVFQENKKIGGAPLNVALRLKSLKNDVAIISKVGSDNEGDEIRDYIKDNNLSVDFIQIDENLKTGSVNVFLNEKGSASYEIRSPRAWDNIELTESIINKVKSSDVFVFGSLVARGTVSRRTLDDLVDVAKVKFFDVNLRYPHYSKEVLLHFMLKADFIKFNSREIKEIVGFFNEEFSSLEESILFVKKKTNTKNICVTKGGRGAVLYYEGSFYYNNGFQVEVIDTVGAGDSFFASLISMLLGGELPQEALDYASAVGAIVAASEGANPKIEGYNIMSMLKGEAT